MTMLYRDDTDVRPTTAAIATYPATAESSLDAPLPAQICPADPISAQGPALSGAAPVFPFADRFFGHIDADGQRARVAALACEPDGAVVLLSLVGYDTSVSAAAAQLHSGKALTFVSAPDVRWEHTTQLTRPACGSKQAPASLLGTPERHLVVYARAADIAHGLLDAPAPRPPSAPSDEGHQPGEHPGSMVRGAEQPSRNLAGSGGGSLTDSSAHAEQRQPSPRYLFGNWNEAGPDRNAFLGHLRALRVIHLPGWADALWRLGLERSLITPLPALGVCAWRITDDLLAWGQLLGDGVKAGVLAAPDTLVAPEPIASDAAPAPVDSDAPAA